MPTIETLKQAHPGEWLAIAIPERAEARSADGELVFHSPDEGEVWKTIKGDRRHIYVIFAGPLLPEGCTAAF